MKKMIRSAGAIKKLMAATMAAALMMGCMTGCGGNDEAGDSGIISAPISENSSEGSNSDVSAGTEVGTGVDTNAGTEVSNGADTSAGTEVSNGADASAGTEVSTGVNVSAGTEVSTGNDTSTGAGNVSTPSTDNYNLEEEFNNLEVKAAEIENRAMNAVTQAELNACASDDFRLWDDELNLLWTRLDNILDGTAMGMLTEEQNMWIEVKEFAADQEGIMYEGGSMQGMVMNGVYSSFTRTRCYELAELLASVVDQSFTFPELTIPGYYVDTMGTDEVYSELIISPAENNDYEIEMGIFRLSTFKATGTDFDHILSYADNENGIYGRVFITFDGKAVMYASSSSWPLVKDGEMFYFSQKRY